MDRIQFEAAVYELRVAWLPDTTQVYYEPTVLACLRQNLKLSPLGYSRTEQVEE